MAKFGKCAKNGQVEFEPTECILTGRELVPPYDNTVCYAATGTPYFYRVLGSQHHLMTDEMREEWAKEAANLDAPVSVAKKSTPAPEVKHD